MEQSLKDDGGQTWVDYCGMTPSNQFIWGEKVDALNKAMLLLMNLKNDNAKKDLRLAFSQGNKIAYPLNLVSMARCLLSQYNIKNVNNNPCDKKGNKNGKKGDETK